MPRNPGRRRTFEEYLNSSNRSPDIDFVSTHTDVITYPDWAAEVVIMPLNTGINMAHEMFVREVLLPKLQSRTGRQTLARFIMDPNRANSVLVEGTNIQIYPENLRIPGTRAALPPGYIGRIHVEMKKALLRERAESRAANFERLSSIFTRTPAFKIESFKDEEFFNITIPDKLHVRVDATAEGAMIGTVRIPTSYKLDMMGTEELVSILKNLGDLV